MLHEGNVRTLDPAEGRNDRSQLKELVKWVYNRFELKERTSTQ